MNQVQLDWKTEYTAVQYFNNVRTSQFFLPNLMKQKIGIV